MLQFSLANAGFADDENPVITSSDSRSKTLRGGSGGIPDTIANATTDGNQVDPAHADRRQPGESGSGRQFASLNPATGEVLGHVPDATVADAEAAVAAARTAFDATDWATNTELRVRCLQQLHAALVEHRGEMGQLTTDEVGAAALAGRPVRPSRSRSSATTPGLLKTYPDDG